MFDVTGSTPTSAKAAIPWRDTKLTFIWLRAGGPILSAYTIDEKRQVLANLRDGDQVLAVRQVQYPIHQEVMVINDLNAPREALSA